MGAAELCETMAWNIKESRDALQTNEFIRMRKDSETNKHIIIPPDVLKNPKYNQE